MLLVTCISAKAAPAAERGGVGWGAWRRQLGSEAEAARELRGASTGAARRRQGGGAAPAGERGGAGNGWFGMVRNGAYVVTGVRQIPLLPALLFLFLAAGGIMLAWLREGK